MVQEFTGKAVVITGAASGFGKAIATRLSRINTKLALIDRDQVALSALQLQDTADVRKYCIDITVEEEVKNSIMDIGRAYERIDILINSAGITGRTGINSEEVDTLDLQQVFSVNFLGSFYTSKYVLPIMKKNSYGRILHIASIAGKEGNAGMLAYSCSKAAVIAMAKVQGKEYADANITVNALAPAVIKTSMVEQMPVEQVKYMTERIPMKRCGTLEELVDTVLFIVSESNGFTTGFTYDLSGGRATY